MPLEPARDRSPSPARMPPPPRPDSPTFTRLLSLAEQGRRGILSVPDRPAGTRRATVDQQTVGRTRRIRKAAARRQESNAPIGVPTGGF